MLDNPETRKRIALVAVLFLVAGVTVWYLCFRDTGPQINPRISLVCVATGKVYERDRAKVGPIPAQNPDTRERTLLPYEVKEDGKVVIVARYKSLLQQLLKEKNEHVDPTTLVVSGVQ